MKVKIGEPASQWFKCRVSVYWSLSLTPFDKFLGGGKEDEYGAEQYFEIMLILLIYMLPTYSRRCSSLFHIDWFHLRREIQLSVRWKSNP